MVIALLTVACPGSRRVLAPEADGPPNILLISLDTLRADHMSLYGYGRKTTPNLDRFARDSVYFDIAYSTSSTTGPSHATLFTSLHPVEHGVRKNAMTLGDELTSLPELFQARSYRTCAVVSSFILHRRFGWQQGFDSFYDEFDGAASKQRLVTYQGIPVSGGFDRRGNITTDLAIRWLEQDRSTDIDREPFFLFVHYFDPHEPYQAPWPFSRRFRAHDGDEPGADMKLAYDREIAYVDRQVGDLLTYLDRSGLADRTLVVVTADHGQGLKQYEDYSWHTLQIYEGLVRGPMIFRWPNRIPPRRIAAAPTSAFDVAPTILGLAGFGDVDLGHRGRDLSQVLLGAQDDSGQLVANHPIHLYRQHFEKHRIDGIDLLGEQFGLVVAPWKLIYAPDEERLELYQLARDPGERTNLAGEQPEQVERMLEILRPDFERKAPLVLDRELSDEERAGLRALGYAQ